MKKTKRLPLCDFDPSCPDVGDDCHNIIYRHTCKAADDCPLKNDPSHVACWMHPSDVSDEYTCVSLAGSTYALTGVIPSTDASPISTNPFSGTGSAAVASAASLALAPSLSAVVAPSLSQRMSTVLPPPPVSSRRASLAVPLDPNGFAGASQHLLSSLTSATGALSPLSSTSLPGAPRPPSPPPGPPPRRAVVAVPARGSAGANGAAAQASAASQWGSHSLQSSSLVASAPLQGAGPSAAVSAAPGAAPLAPLSLSASSISAAAVDAPSVDLPPMPPALAEWEAELKSRAALLSVKVEASAMELQRQLQSFAAKQLGGGAFAAGDYATPVEQQRPGDAPVMHGDFVSLHATPYAGAAASFSPPQPVAESAGPQSAVPERLGTSVAIERLRELVAAGSPSALVAKLRSEQGIVPPVGTNVIESPGGVLMATSSSRRASAFCSPSGSPEADVSVNYFAPLSLASESATRPPTAVSSQCSAVASATSQDPIIAPCPSCCLPGEVGKLCILCAIPLVVVEPNYAAGWRPGSAMTKQQRIKLNKRAAKPSAVCSACGTHQIPASLCEACGAPLNNRLLAAVKAQLDSLELDNHALYRRYFRFWTNWHKNRRAKLEDQEDQDTDLAPARATAASVKESAAKMLEETTCQGCGDAGPRGGICRVCGTILDSELDFHQLCTPLGQVLARYLDDNKGIMYITLSKWILWLRARKPLIVNNESFASTSAAETYQEMPCNDCGALSEPYSFCRICGAHVDPEVREAKRKEALRSVVRLFVTVAEAKCPQWWYHKLVQYHHLQKQKVEDVQLQSEAGSDTAKDIDCPSCGYATTTEHEFCIACGELLQPDAKSAANLQSFNALHSVGVLPRLLADDSDDSGEEAPVCGECGADLARGALLCLVCGHDAAKSSSARRTPPLEPASPVPKLLREDCENCGSVCEFDTICPCCGQYKPPKPTREELAKRLYEKNLSLKLQDMKQLFQLLRLYSSQLALERVEAVADAEEILKQVICPECEKESTRSTTCLCCGTFVPADAPCDPETGPAAEATLRAVLFKRWLLFLSIKKAGRGSKPPAKPAAKGSSGPTGKLASRFGAPPEETEAEKPPPPRPKTAGKLASRFGAPPEEAEAEKPPPPRPKTAGKLASRFGAPPEETEAEKPPPPRPKTAGKLASRFGAPPEETEAEKPPPPRPSGKRPSGFSMFQ